MPKLTKEELAPYESKLSQMAAMLKFMGTAPIVSITVLNPGDAKTDPLQFNCTMTGTRIAHAKGEVKMELEHQMDVIRQFIAENGPKRRAPAKKPVAAKRQPANTAGKRAAKQPATRIRKRGPADR